MAGIMGLFDGLKTKSPASGTPDAAPSPRAAPASVARRPVPVPRAVAEPGAREDAQAAQARPAGVRVARQRNSGPRFIALDDEMRNTLLAEKRKVISGPPESDAPIRLPTAAHRIMVVLEGGILVVSDVNLSSPSIEDAMDLVKEAGFQIERFYSASLGDIKDLAESIASDAYVESGNLEKMQKEVFELLDVAVRQVVTDIQIHATKVSTKVRFCINDQWVKYTEWPSEYGHQFITCFYNLATTSNDGTDKPGEHLKARISVGDWPMPGNLESVRIQASPASGESRVLVARLLLGRRQKAAMKTLKELGYDTEHLITLDRINDTPFGVVFVAGPTGSGKSTTLAVVMENGFKQKEGRRNYVTIEDPAEYAIEGAIQYQVTNATDEKDRREKFNQAFSAVLRSKPHVIMVGEVRDGPAAAMLFQAAQSGHLSYSTVHAKDALTIPMRLKEIGVDPFMLKDESILIGIVFQRLLRKVCPHCAIRLDRLEPGQEIVLSQNQREFVDIVTDYDYRPLRFRNRSGCEKCARPGGAREPGIAGQTVVAEVIQPSETMLHAVLEGRRNDAINEWLTARDALTAFEHAIRKMWRGEIDPRDVFENMYDRHQLERLREDAERRDYVRRGLDVRPDAKLAEPRALTIEEGDATRAALEAARQAAE